MLEPITAILHTGSLLVNNLFSRNQRIEQTAILRSNQEQERKFQQLQIYLQKQQLQLGQDQLQLDKDQQELSKLQLKGQIKQAALLKEQIEHQKLQIDTARQQLAVQIAQTAISHETLKTANHSQELIQDSNRMHSEMLEIVKLQYAVVSVIALASIVWLGIQIFPVILPLLESSSKFLLKGQFKSEVHHL